MNKTAISQKKQGKLNYTLIRGVLFWCALVVVSSAYVTTPILAKLAAEFNVTEEVASWTSSSFSLFYAIGFLFFGPISDRFGCKQVIVFGLGMLSIVTLVIGFVDQFILLVTFRGIQGFFASTFAPTALSYVFNLFPLKERVTAIGLISFGYVLSGLFGQVVSDFIMSLFHFHMIFLLFGFIYFVTLMIVYFCLPRTASRVTKINLNHYLKQIRAILKKRQLILCYIITILLLLTFMGMYTVLADYLTTPSMYSEKFTVSTVRGLGILGMILSPFAGFFVKKIGLVKLLRGSLAVSVIGLVFIGFGQTLWFVALMSVLYVAGISLIFPTIMMLIGDIAGENRATAASLYAFILFFGATLGPIVALKLMQFENYIVTFGGLGTLLMIGLIASFLIKTE